MLRKLKKEKLWLILIFLLVIVAAVIFLGFGNSQEKILEASSINKEETFNTIWSLAEDTNTLEIENCKPEPLVLKIVRGRIITVKNLDNLARTLNIANKEYQILAGTTEEITADFEEKFTIPTAYGYWCDAGEKLAGYIVVTE